MNAANRRRRALRRLSLRCALAFLIAAESAAAADIGRVIEKRYPGCAAPVYCGDMVRVDCGAAVDGPLYFLDGKSGEEISACGGACWAPESVLREEGRLEACRTLCPPPEWTCD